MKHEMIPPNMYGQYTCAKCSKPWPCPAALFLHLAPALALGVITILLALATIFIA